MKKSGQGRFGAIGGGRSGGAGRLVRDRVRRGRLMSGRFQTSRTPAGAVLVEKAAVVTQRLNSGSGRISARGRAGPVLGVP